jgi:Arc/MetJ-type ribon-helix-helix transcriptional regulator
MNISIRLPENTEQRLDAYCALHGISKSEAVRRALDGLLNSNNTQPTPYELGKEGFGADSTHSGNIALESKRLLRERMSAKTHR